MGVDEFLSRFASDAVDDGGHIPSSVPLVQCGAFQIDRQPPGRVSGAFRIGHQRWHKGGAAAGYHLCEQI